MMDAPYSMDQEIWEYLDPKGQKQGPFSGNRMRLWYQNKMLPEDLGVRHSPAMPFEQIRDMFIKDGLPPFMSRPRPAPVMWQYRDTKGQLQGPFSSPQMKQWYDHGMLPKSLQLRRTTDPNFATITEFFPPPRVPFESPPVAPLSHGQYAGGFAGAAAMGALGAFTGMGLIAAAAAANQSLQGGKAIPQGKVPQQPKAAPAAVGKQAAKAKAEPKAKAVAKAAEAAAGYPAQDAKGKGKGKQGNEVPAAAAKDKGRGKKDASKDHHEGWDACDWWSNDKWWEWSSWNGGWSGDCWDGNGKQQGAEWKGNKQQQPQQGGADSGEALAAGSAKDKAERTNAVQAAFGNLSWGPHAEAADLLPEDTIRKVQDEGIVWEERWVCPLLVRFSQGKIHPFFHGRGPISEVMLQIKLRAAEGQEGQGAEVRRIDPPFPPIRLLHLKEQGVLVTLDNRRLYALQRFALQEWPRVCLARALCVDELTPTRLRAENRKFTNRLCGLQLEVESRQNAFDTFSWVTDAAHQEAPKFCRPLAFRASEKVISLLPMLVVHALVSQKLRPLLASRWPLLRLVASLVPSPSRREFECRRLLRQHVLELPRPSRRTSTCPPLCVRYKAETVVTLSKGKSCVTSKLSVCRPLQLEQGDPLSEIQRRTLRALLPLFCLPYARSALKGETRTWVEAVLVAWGKVTMSRLQLTP